MAVTLRGILCLILLLRMLGGIFLTRSEAMVKNCEKKSSKRVKLPLQSSCLWYLYDICLFIFISVVLYLLFLPLCSLPIQQKRSWYCSLTFARLPRTRGKRRLGGVEPRYYQQEAANLFFQRAEEISILEVMRSSCFSTFLEWFVGSFV